MADESSKSSLGMIVGRHLPQGLRGDFGQSPSEDNSLLSSYILHCEKEKYQIQINWKMNIFSATSHSCTVSGGLLSWSSDYLFPVTRSLWKSCFFVELVSSGALQRLFSQTFHSCKLLGSVKSPGRAASSPRRPFSMNTEEDWRNPAPLHRILWCFVGRQI